MRIGVSSFANNSQIAANSDVDKAKLALAKGEPVILETGGSHNEKAISQFLSSPNFQKDVVVGTTVGAGVGVVAGAVVRQILQTHSVAGVVGELLLGIIGGAVGHLAAQDASTVVRPSPAGKAATGGGVPTPAVAITYDAHAGQIFAQLMQQYQATAVASGAGVRPPVAKP